MRLENKNIVLHLPLNGNDNATSTKDFSPYNHTITFHGNAKLSKTRSMNHMTSLYLDGTASYLSFPDNKHTNLAASDFVISWDMWLNSYSSNMYVFYKWVADNTCWMVQIDPSSNKLYFLWTVLGLTDPSCYKNVYGTFTFATKKWYSCKIIRFGSVIKMIINNMLIPVTMEHEINNDCIYDGTVDLTIGTSWSGHYFDGYIDNVMIVKNETFDNYEFGLVKSTKGKTGFNDYYTSKEGKLISAWNFNNPIPTKDSSKNNHGLINHNNTLFERNDQFDSNVATFVNGSNHYFTIPNHSDFQFGSSNFIFNVWIKCDSFPDILAIYNHAKDISSTSTFLSFQYRSGDGLNFYYYYNDTLMFHLLEGSRSITDNNFHMITVVRNGSKIYGFIDKKQVASITTSVSMVSFGEDPTIGVLSPPLSHYFFGSMKHFYIWKGTYFSNETDIYKFLNHIYNNQYVDNKGFKFESNSVNNILYEKEYKFVNQTSSKDRYLKANWKFGKYEINDVINNHTLTNGNSVTFTADGVNGKCAKFVRSSNQNLYCSNSDFMSAKLACSFWFKLSTVPCPEQYLFLTNGSTSTANWYITYNSSNQIRFEWRESNGSYITSQPYSIYLASDEWNHIVAIADGYYIYLYLNSNLITTQSYNGTVNQESGYVYIGGDGSSGNKLDGYMDEVCYYVNPEFTDSYDRQDFVDYLFRYNKYKFNDEDKTQQSKMVAGWPLFDDSDIIGNYNLSFVNSPSFDNDGLYGKCVTLNGSNQYLTMVDNPTLSLNTDNFVIVCWVYFNTNSTTQCIINTKNSGESFMIYYSGSNKVYFMSYNGSVYTVEIYFDWTPSTSTWYQLCFIRNGTTSSNWRFYVNGTNQTISLSSGAWNGNIVDFIGDIHIGHNVTDGWFFNGRMAHFYIWQKTSFTNSTDMDNFVSYINHSNRGRYLHKTGYGNFVKPDIVENQKTLLHCWKLDEPVGDKLDVIGNVKLTDNNSVARLEDDTFGYVSDFNGSNQYYSISPIPHTTIKYDIISLWVKFDTLSPTYQEFFTMLNSNSGNYNYLIRTQSSNNKIYCLTHFTSGSVEITGTTTLAIDTWYHIVYIIDYDGSNASGYLYVNNHYEGSDTGSGSCYTPNQFGIGASAPSCGSPTNGQMHNVMWFRNNKPMLHGKTERDAFVNKLYNSKKPLTLQLSNSHKTAYHNNSDLDMFAKYLTFGSPLDKVRGDNYDLIKNRKLIGYNDISGSYDTLLGTVAEFNGTDQYIKIENGNYINPTEGVAVSFWMNRDNNSSTQEVFGNTYNESSGGYRLYLDSSGITFALYQSNNTGVSITYSTQPSHSNWHHIVCIADNTQNKLYLYIDNVEVGTAVSYNGTMGNNSRDMYLGTLWNGSSNNEYDGKLCDFKIYKDPVFSTNTDRETFVNNLYKFKRPHQLTKTDWVQHRQHSRKYYEYNMDNNNDNHLLTACPLTEIEGNRLDIHNHINAVVNGTSVDSVVDPEYGRCVEFKSANSSYLLYSHSEYDLNAVLATRKWTIAFLFKKDGKPSSSEYVVTCGDDSSTVLIVNIDTNGYLKTYVQNTSNVSKSADYDTDICDNEWHLIVLTCDLTNYKLYVDNSLKDSDTSVDSIRDDNLGVALGCYSANGTPGYYLNGYMRNFYFWDKALSTTQINTLYTSKPNWSYFNYELNRPFPSYRPVMAFPLTEIKGNRTDLVNSYILTDNNNVLSDIGKTKKSCALFSGSNYLSMTNSVYDTSALFATNMFSILFWVKAIPSSDDYVLSCLETSSPYNGILIYSHNNNVRFEVYNSSNADHVDSIQPVFNNNWNRVCITFNNKICDIYVNGYLNSRKTISYTIGDGSATLRIGVDNSTTYYLQGRLQELDILDIPVDESFVVDDWNDGKGKFYE